MFLLLYDILIRKGQNLRFQSKNSEALAVFKEKENEVEASSAYHPNHPMVEQAKLFGIEIYAEINEYKNAESLRNITDILMSIKERNDLLQRNIFKRGREYLVPIII
jgi:hypothetical protein